MSCNKCHRPYLPGATICQGCHREILKGATYTEIQNGAKSGVVIGLGASLFIMYWAPGLLNTHAGQHLHLGWGLGFGSVVPVAIVTVVGYLVGAAQVRKTMADKVRTL